MSDLFQRFQIARATQLTTKSDQWYEETLLAQQRERYSLTLYLGGFVIECLLKASLWSRRFEPRVRALLFASHDLAALLATNPALSRGLEGDLSVHSSFVRLTSWHVRFRYNPKRATREDAGEFLRRLREVRLWLRGKV